MYAIGDIHGRYDLLVALLKAISDDMATMNSATPPLLVFLGDYVDRGPGSTDVLTTLIWLSRYAEFDVTFLRGNHEEMMLAFLGQPREAAAWLRHGGAETLRAYGIDVPHKQDSSEECVQLRNELMDRLPVSHLTFLQSLEMYAIYGDYVFVHAGLRPNVPIQRQVDDDLLWIREDFLEAQGPFERIVVHGHTWHSDIPVLTRHRIGIDTGAYKTGALTALRLEAGTIAFIQARASITEHHTTD